MKTIGYTTTKTQRNKDCKEYFASDYGSLIEAGKAALTAHPRKRTFYAIYMRDDGKAYAWPIDLRSELKGS